MPEEFQDFSDDEHESERQLRRKAALKGNSRKRNSLERHQNFVHKMNKRNTLDTVSQIAMDHYHQGGPSTTTNTAIPPPQCYQFMAPPPPLAVPAFDPTRLPPPPPPPPDHAYTTNFTFPPDTLWGYGHPQPPGS